jgi:hypothetical protein
MSASANDGEKYMHTLDNAMAYWESDEGYAAEIPKQKVYFYMPEKWYNEHNDYYDANVGLDSCAAGVYWWGSTAEPAQYLPMYSKMHGLVMH